MESWMRTKTLATVLCAAIGSFIAAPAAAQGAKAAKPGLHAQDIQQLTGAKG
jgi:hypothetical protein